MLVVPEYSLTMVIGRVWCKSGKGRLCEEIKMKMVDL